MHTSSGELVAPVTRAGVAVAAVLDDPWYTSTVLAGVASGTSVAVVACPSYWAVHATARAVAPVLGAGVPVVAVQRHLPQALVTLAVIAERAPVAVVADRPIVRGIDAASGSRVAQVLGAGVFVVAGFLAENAPKVRIARVHRTQIAVVARQQSVSATDRLLAPVRGARVLVVAVEDGVFATPRFGIAPVRGTRVLVAAVLLDVDFTHFRIARVDRAGVVVMDVKHQKLTGWDSIFYSTCSIPTFVGGGTFHFCSIADPRPVADIGNGTGVAIVARSSKNLSFVLTDPRSAGVVGAGVSVVAVGVVGARLATTTLL